MKIFIDDEFKFIIEDSISSNLTSIDKVIIITLDNSEEGNNDMIKIATIITKDICRVLKDGEFLDNSIITIKYSDLNAKFNTNFL